MSVPQNFSKLVGKWSGMNRLHMPWDEENPLHESATTATVELQTGGKFWQIEYEWSYEGASKEGLLLLGVEEDSGSAQAIWIDSWHMNEKFMVSEGAVGNGGAISVKGFYSVPGHPDWGWRTDIEAENSDSLKIVMYNVTPEGEESLAVEMEFVRL